jgi:hypothetical protein
VYQQRKGNSKAGGVEGEKQQRSLGSQRRQVLFPKSCADVWRQGLWERIRI